MMIMLFREGKEGAWWHSRTFYRGKWKL